MSYKILRRDNGKYLVEILDGFERPTGRTVFVDDKGLAIIRGGEFDLAAQPPVGHSVFLNIDGKAVLDVSASHDGTPASHLLIPKAPEAPKEPEPETQTPPEEPSGDETPEEDTPPTEPEAGSAPPSKSRKAPPATPEPEPAQ